MRCTRCGNDNAEGNRFCGMCGAPVAPATQAPSRPVNPPSVGAMPGTRTERTAAPAANADRPPTRPAPTNLRSSSDRQEAEPAISGPSFLGLNQPGQPRAGFKRGDSGGSSDLLRPSGSVDYLLEDDEDEPKRGWGKVILVLVALALAGGFAYLHWKQGGFNWIYGSGGKPAATQPDSGSASSGSDSGSPGIATPGTPSANPAPTLPGAAAAASGAANPSATNPTGSGSSTSSGTAAGSALGAPSSSAAAPPTDAGANPAAQPPAPQAAANSSQATPPSISVQNNSPTGAQASGSESQTAAPAAPPVASNSDSGAQSPQDEQPAPPPAARPAPKVAPPKPVDTVTDAERYIYGRGGTGKDCDRGLRMLKSAADRSDAKAMISLGGLYSAGTCTPRDLPTAYRWFALALHKQPDNQTLQNDLQQLWSRMTQAERQLAIRLSQ